MGRRGPHPQPEPIRQQRAAVRSSRLPRVHGADASVVAAGAPEPPKWLKGEGLKIWNRLAQTLRAAKLLTEADTFAFARYCRNYARWLDAERLIDREGATYESESQWGKLKRVNPVFLIADRLERQLLASEDRFGLNPAERQRIMAARAQTGVSGDLFAPPPEPARRDNDPAAQPIEPAEPAEEPVGLLN